MANKRVNCPMCGIEVDAQTQPDTLQMFYSCPVCGRYELGHSEYTDVIFSNENHVAHYLFYHCFEPGNYMELRYHTRVSDGKP